MIKLKIFYHNLNLIYLTIFFKLTMDIKIQIAEKELEILKKEREILRREPLPQSHPIQQRVYWKILTKIVYKNVGESEFRVNGKLEDFFYVNHPNQLGFYSNLHKEYKLKKIFKKGRLYIDGLFFGENMKYKTFMNNYYKYNDLDAKEYPEKRKAVIPFIL